MAANTKLPKRTLSPTALSASHLHPLAIDSVPVGASPAKKRRGAAGVPGSGRRLLSPAAANAALPATTLFRALGEFQQKALLQRCQGAAFLAMASKRCAACAACLSRAHTQARALQAATKNLQCIRIGLVACVSWKGPVIKIRWQLTPQ